MKAAVLTEIGKIEYTDIERPELKENEVLIKVKSVGICGSDIHFWKHGKIGNSIVEDPFILGHEFSGEVVKCGENVSKLTTGDLVVVEPGEVCGKCEYCRSGRYNLCPEMKFFASTSTQIVIISFMSSWDFFLLSGLGLIPT